MDDAAPQVGEAERAPSGGNALPRYLQIAERLIREIAAGRLADGARLPPEREMAGGLGISVGTLRKALAELEGQGLLSRRQGSGNYVRHRPGASGVYAFFRLEAIGGGGLPTAELIDVVRLAKPAGAPHFGPSAEAHRIRRLRRLDGTVAALEEIWLDGDRAARLTPADLSESLYLHYRDALGFVIGRVEDRIGAGPVPGWSPPEFDPLPGTVVPLVERVSWAAGGAPVEFSRTWIDCERARYVARMGMG